MNVPVAAKNLGKVIEKNSPVILAGVSVGCFGGGIILAVKSTPKAMMLIEQEAQCKLENEGEDLNEVGWFDGVDPRSVLTPMEMIQTSWKCYIPSIGLFVLGTACIIGSVKMSGAQKVALAGAASFAEKALYDYKQKVIDILGEDKAIEIQESLMKDRLAETPVPEDSSEVVVVGNGKYLCFDSITGRYFRSDKESVRKAMNDFNHDLIGGTFESLNTWFYYLGLPGVTIGESLGWNSDRQLDVRFTSMIADTGEPCMVLDYYTLPRSTYIEDY